MARELVGARRVPRGLRRRAAGGRRGARPEGPLQARRAPARSSNFTGIDSPYEAPLAPDLRLDTTSGRRRGARRPDRRAAARRRLSRPRVRQTPAPPMAETAPVLPLWRRTETSQNRRCPRTQQSWGEPHRFAPPEQPAIGAYSAAIRSLSAHASSIVQISAKARHCGIPVAGIWRTGSVGESRRSFAFSGAQVPERLIDTG